MNVPNHEKKAFRDMTPEQMGAIASSIIAGEIEYWSSFSRKWMTPGRAMGGLDFEAVYRTRQKQLVIPWEHIKPEYKWAAMDECGDVAIYDAKPEMSDDSWLCGKFGHGNSLELHALNIDTAGIDWHESLTARPEGV